VGSLAVYGEEDVTWISTVVSVAFVAFAVHEL